MVGRELNDLFPKEHAEPGAEVLRVENLSLRAQNAAGESGGRALSGISFALRRGEILGVAGLMGAGRTELLETLFGVHAPSRVGGKVFVNGKERRFAAPQDAIAAGLALVTEDRKGQSLLLDLSVAHNVTLAALRQFTRGGLLLPRAEAAAVQSSVEKLRVKVASTRVLVGTLSGGNQQKVVLAKCLLTAPSVLLLDEPTRGIDVGAKAEIYSLISGLAARGAGIVMVSSELPEILSMCDRVLVMCEGRVSAELSRDDATSEKILHAATAHQTAQAAWRTINDER